jgi:ABC-type sugar transport system ATPase subunit
MEGDFDLPEDQILEFEIELAEAMGAEAHLHIMLDVPVVELDGQPLSVEDGDEIAMSTTKIIARIDGIHYVTSGDSLRLGVKTHLAHFFDPDTGLPLA